MSGGPPMVSEENSEQGVDSYLHETGGPPYLIRGMVESDRNLILDSWLRSKLDRSKRGQRWTRDEVQWWYRVHRPTVIKLLDESDVLVAADPDAQQGKADILGWIAYDGAELRYVYVIQLFRGRGIARALRQAAGHL